MQSVGPEDDEIRVRLILELGRSLHAYGTTSDQIEEALALCGESLGVALQVSATPTALLIAVGEHTGQRTYLQRLQPGGLDDNSLKRVQRIMADLLRGDVSARRALGRVESVRRTRPLYGVVPNCVGPALVACSSAVFLGGGQAEAAVASAIGLVVGGLIVLSSHVERLRSLLEPVAGFAAGLFAILGAVFVGPLSFFVTSFAGIIALVPGVPLTLAIEELSKKHLTAGATRFLGALASVGMLALGTALGLAFREPLALESAAIREVPLVWPIELGLIVLAAVGLVIMLRAEPTQTVAVVVVLAAGYYGRDAATVVFESPVMGAAVGALLVGVVSNAYSLVQQRPAAMTTLSGLLFLLPVSFGFRCFEDLSRAEVSSGVLSGFRMASVLVAIVLGLFVSTLLMPPYRPRPPVREATRSSRHRSQDLAMR